jgi:hypothetical protein
MNKWVELFSVTSNQNKSTLFEGNGINFQGQSREYEQHDFYLNNNTKEKALLCFLGNANHGGLQHKVNTLLISVQTQS